MISHRTLSRLRAPKVVIVVNRERFELHHHRKTSGQYLRKTFPIAVGKVGNTTPPGVYYVDARAKRPDWLIPRDADYEPSLWGVVVPFTDPANPFEGGFLSLSDKGGVGLHGVKGDAALGTRASHGCIRLATPDILWLYRHTPLGSPVVIT